MDAPGSAQAPVGSKQEVCDRKATPATSRKYLNEQLKFAQTKTCLQPKIMSICDSDITDIRIVHEKHKVSIPDAFSNVIYEPNIDMQTFETFHKAAPETSLDFRDNIGYLQGRFDAIPIVDNSIAALRKLLEKADLK